MESEFTDTRNFLENVNFNVFVPSSKSPANYFAWKILFSAYTKGVWAI